MKGAIAFLPAAILGFALSACTAEEGANPGELNPYASGQSGMSPGAQGSSGAPSGSASSADTPMM